MIVYGKCGEVENSRLCTANVRHSVTFINGEGSARGFFFPSTRFLSPTSVRESWKERNEGLAVNRVNVKGIRQMSTICGEGHNPNKYTV